MRRAPWIVALLLGAMLFALLLASSHLEAWVQGAGEALGANPLRLGFVLAASTLVSEDLTCLGAGALVARGALTFGAAAAACFSGILVGDVLLFLCGRWFGSKLLTRCSWFCDARRVAAAREWLERRGAVVILLARFMPGARLPTYFASGALGTNPLVFTAWFALAGVLWTPLLVGAAAGAGELDFVRDGGLTRAVVCVLVLACAVALLRQLATRRGRALLGVRLTRWMRFEYWPVGVFYLPVFALVGWRALRGQGTRFTAANPALPHGGFVGESKHAIYGLLGRAGAPLPRMVFLARGDPGERWSLAHGLLGPEGPGFPLVVKPDVGQRGDGVRIVRDERELARALDDTREALVLQEFIPGPEFGLFCARETPEGPARLISITRKLLPFVVGDGVRSLERLILEYKEQRGMALHFLERFERELARIPAVGERVALGELGTHCRGARFLDGGTLWTRALEDELARLVARLDGFCIGRFDVRASSEAELCAGRFTILELNGVTSEAAHIYDPRIGLFTAWRSLVGQWRRAYALGDANSEQGVRVSSWRELIRAVRDYGALDEARRTVALSELVPRSLGPGR